MSKIIIKQPFPPNVSLFYFATKKKAIKPMFVTDKEVGF
jgi:hypothetical protein